MIQPSEEQIADLLDVPLTTELPTGPVSQIFQIHTDVSSASAPEPSSITEALAAKSYEDLPSPLHPTAKSIVHYLMDVHCIKTAAHKTAVLKHLPFETPVKAAWAKSTY